jgi:hypothetical protein
MKRIAAAVAAIALSSGIALFGASRFEMNPTPMPREFVQCPLETARTEITSTLPEPWWQTPQEGKLRDVKVDLVGGKTTLSCGYWAYSTTVYVMRLPPKGTSTCRPAKNGFWCY